MTIWMLYATDGDSGYYDIELFLTEATAKARLKTKQDGYHRIARFEVTR